VAVDSIARLDCIGGFVVTLLYGLGRPTEDIDVIELAPRAAAARMMDSAFAGDRCLRSTGSIWTEWPLLPSQRTTQTGLSKCSPVPIRSSI
jgi:hypothetical protein